MATESSNLVLSAEVIKPAVLVVAAGIVAFVPVLEVTTPLVLAEVYPRLVADASGKSPHTAVPFELYTNTWSVEPPLGICLYPGSSPCIS